MSANVNRDKRRDGHHEVEFLMPVYTRKLVENPEGVELRVSSIVRLQPRDACNSCRRHTFGIPLESVSKSFLFIGRKGIIDKDGE